MKINQTTWVMIGVFLWGIPSGVFMALFVTMLKANSVEGGQELDQALLVKNLIIYVPIFIVAGVAYGVFMNRLGLGKKQQRSNE